MKQLTDIPYSTLKENKQAYKIMLLCDQHDNSYADIAKNLGYPQAGLSSYIIRQK